tara:strand:+ start:45 stop:239 length:195 start_codon:yes stop_codon:yes gene_type:complete
MKLMEMNEDQLCEYRDFGDAKLQERVKAEFRRRHAAQDAWSADELARPVWNKPGLYLTKSQWKF